MRSLAIKQNAEFVDWVNESAIFRCLWTKVHEISDSVDPLQFPKPFPDCLHLSCFVPKIFAVTVATCEIVKNYKKIGG